VRDPSEFTLELLRLSGLGDVLLIQDPTQLERGA
jgi:hypothetical protein